MTTLTNGQIAILRALYSDIPCCGCCDGDSSYREHTIRNVITAMGLTPEGRQLQMGGWSGTWSVPAGLEPLAIAGLFCLDFIGLNARGEIMLKR